MNDSNTRQQMAVAAGIMELELRQHKITASVKPLEDGDSSKTDATGREIDLTLPTPYPVTPQIRGAIKAMQGVVMVEEV